MENMLQDLRPHYNGLVIGNEGFNLQSANEAIEKGVVDMVSFGKYALSNPDLPQRFKLN